MKVKLLKTNKMYKPIGYSARKVLIDSSGKEWVKLKGKIWSKTSLEGYTY